MAINRGQPQKPAPPPENLSIQQKEHAAIDEWQTEAQLKPMRIGNIYLYTEGLTPEERGLSGVDVIDGLEKAVRKSAGGHRQVVFIPYGPYALPLVGGLGPAHP